MNITIKKPTETEETQMQSGSAMYQNLTGIMTVRKPVF